jgi:hypothetical protein
VAKINCFMVTQIMYFIFHPKLKAVKLRVTEISYMSALGAQLSQGSRYLHFNTL